jgi:hypothetical protein
VRAGRRRFKNEQDQGRLTPHSLTTALAWAAPRAPSLLPVSACDAWSAHVVGLPAWWDWTVLEAPLLGPQRVDLLTCLTTLGGGKRAVEELGVSAHPMLMTAAAALGSWGATDTLRGAEVVWLEWDADRLPDLAPLVLWSIDPRFWGVRDPASVDRAALLRAAVASCGGRPEEAEAADAVIQGLPAGARALAVTSLRPRGRSVLRLLISFAARQVVPWLSRAWPGDPTWVQDWERYVAPPWERLLVQVEVSDRLESYLALEPPQTALGFPERDERELLLNRLVQLDFADPARATETLGWALAGCDEYTRFVPGFHLKLVGGATGLRQAKAYLHLHRRA